jgi:hypothetical protein
LHPGGFSLSGPSGSSAIQGAAGLQRGISVSIGSEDYWQASKASVAAFNAARRSSVERWMPVISAACVSSKASADVALKLSQAVFRLAFGLQFIAMWGGLKIILANKKLKVCHAQQIKQKPPMAAAEKRGLLNSKQ